MTSSKIWNNDDGNVSKKEIRDAQIETIENWAFFLNNSPKGIGDLIYKDAKYANECIIGDFNKTPWDYVNFIVGLDGYHFSYFKKWFVLNYSFQDGLRVDTRTENDLDAEDMPIYHAQLRAMDYIADFHREYRWKWKPAIFGELPTAEEVIASVFVSGGFEAYLRMAPADMRRDAINKLLDLYE